MNGSASVSPLDYVVPQSSRLATADAEVLVLHSLRYMYAVDATTVLSDCSLSFERGVLLSLAGALCTRFGPRGALFRSIPGLLSASTIFLIYSWMALQKMKRRRSGCGLCSRRARHRRRCAAAQTRRSTPPGRQL